MNKIIKVFVGCFFLLAILGISVAQAQDMTELKIRSGIREASEFKVAVAVKLEEDQPAMVAKVITLEEFGDFELFSIPSTSLILISTFPIDTPLNEMETVSDESVYTYLALEDVTTCTITVKKHDNVDSFVVSIEN